MTTLDEAIEIYELRHLRKEPYELLEILKAATSKAEKVAVCNLLSIFEYNYSSRNDRLACAEWVCHELGTFLKYETDLVKSAANEAWYAADEIRQYIKTEIEQERSIWGRRF